MSPAKTAESIEMPYGMCTWVGPRKHILDEGAHWRHRVNTLNCPCAAALRPFCQLL